VLTRVNCASSHCPVELQRVLTMSAGQVTVAYEAFLASLELGPASATFDGPAYAEFSAGCCPNGRLVQTVGLDTETDRVGVIDAQLALCTEGTFQRVPSLGEHVVAVRCAEGERGAAFQTTDQTAVEPATVGGITGLQDGDRVRVEFIVKECPDSLLDCDPSKNGVTPVATKITVLGR